ncbi:Imm5 family immunity protein [Bacteroides ovatus]|nr:Imm5 family immunity protein [Bacteroides ovatus]
MNIKTLFSHFMKDRQARINELKVVVTQSDNGHLPLPYRVKLLQSIGNVEIVNKVFAECCKKVYSIWGNEIEDALLRKLLYSANEYLYHGKGKADVLVEEANRLRNFVEEQCCAEGMAGWSVISLCYSIADAAAAMLDIDEYKGEDDGTFDYEVWNTDFFASIAFAGGNPFVGEGDAGKRREFWNWYLDTVETLCRKPDAPLIGLDAPKEQEEEQNAIPQRTQTYRTSAILAKIQEVVDSALALYKKDYNDKWDKIIISARCMAGGVRVNNYVVKKEQPYKIKTSLESFQTMSDIKKEMYDQAKAEGAWFYCVIELNPDLTYSIRFVYDDKSQIPQDHFIDADDFKCEFEKYPRAKEYTPVWWQGILGKKARYLKSTVAVEQVAIPQRTQTYQTPAIQEKIQQVITNSLEAYDKYHTEKWDKIIIKTESIGSISTNNLFILKEITNEFPASWKNFDLMEEIKDEMYSQAGFEGAWLTCIIEVMPDKTFAICFNYDKMPNNEAPDKFNREFKNYPRAKEYTPVWWQEILGKKARYLE